jgi:hypothetical protein
MSDNGSPHQPHDGGAAPPADHLNIKVTDNTNEVFFKIKRNTELRKLMEAFCSRQGKDVKTCRFMFDGDRVAASDTPDSVSCGGEKACFFGRFETNGALT